MEAVVNAEPELENNTVSKTRAPEVIAAGCGSYRLPACSDVSLVETRWVPPWSIEKVKLVLTSNDFSSGSFIPSYSYRTSVDLKDKWRNLLRASFTQLPADKGVDTSRKQASIPIPAPILVRVRELAEMQAQVPPNRGGGKFAGHSSRVVHERKSGYL